MVSATSATLSEGGHAISKNQKVLNWKPGAYYNMTKIVMTIWLDYFCKECSNPCLPYSITGQNEG